VELVVALVILAFITLFATTIFLNYTQRTRELKAANLVYEEGRYLMGRLMNEIRQNTIDYEGYFNQNVMNGALGQNFCAYDQVFYTPSFDEVIGTSDDESLGMRDPDALFQGNPITAPLINPQQDNLFLINQEGNQRVYFTRIERKFDDDPLGKLGLLKLVGKDFGDDQINGFDSYNGLNASNPLCQPDPRENDGLIDTWQCDSDFNCDEEILAPNINVDLMPGCDGYIHQAYNDIESEFHSFVDISPNAVNLVDLQFTLHPEDDPHKAYRVDELQIQPYITVQMTLEANPKLASGLDPEKLPTITLTSTASTRNYVEVPSGCI